MRIAYICSDVEVEVLGNEGCSVHVRELTNALIELGHEVSILCAWPGSGAAAEAKATVLCPEPAGLAAVALRQLEHEPLVRNNHLQRDLHSMWHNLWLAGEGAEVLRRHRPDFIYERYALFGWAGVDLARRLGIPHLLEINAPLCDQQDGYEKFVLTRTARNLEAEIFRSSNGVIVLAPWMRKWAVSRGASKSRVHLIPDAVSERVFGPEASGDAVLRKYGLLGRRTVGFVGSFQHWHDVPGLLRAFAKLYGEDDNLRLLLVGDGDERQTAQRLARRLGIADAVIFTGAVRHEQVPRYIAAMDVPVVPYGKLSEFYFSPMKMFEYMAVGRPAVAAALGQMAEVIKHGRDGWLYTAGDVDSLAEGIRTILYDPQLAARMGAAARRKVLSRHTWRNVAEQVIELATKLRAGPAPSGTRRKSLQTI